MWAEGRGNSNEIRDCSMSELKFNSSISYEYLFDVMMTFNIICTSTAGRRSTTPWRLERWEEREIHRAPKTRIRWKPPNISPLLCIHISLYPSIRLVYSSWLYLLSLDWIDRSGWRRMRWAPLLLLPLEYDVSTRRSVCMQSAATGRLVEDRQTNSLVREAPSWCWWRAFVFPT